VYILLTKEKKQKVGLFAYHIEQAWRPSFHVCMKVCIKN